MLGGTTEKDERPTHQLNKNGGKINGKKLNFYT